MPNPQSKRIIAFSGRAGVGKTTAAKFLASHFNAIRVAFANPVKELAMRVHGLRYDQVYGTQEDKECPSPYHHNETPRAVLQRLGVACRDVLGADVWLNAAMHKIQQAPNGLYVIDDARFPNEIAAIHNSGGHVIKIVAPDAPPVSNPGHPSETGPDDVDQKLFHDVIYCPRALGEFGLQSKVLLVMTQLGFDLPPAEV